MTKKAEHLAAEHLATAENPHISPAYVRFLRYFKDMVLAANPCSVVAPENSGIGFPKFATPTS